MSFFTDAPTSLEIGGTALYEGEALCLFADEATGLFVLAAVLLMLTLLVLLLAILLAASVVWAGIDVVPCAVGTLMLACISVPVAALASAGEVDVDVVVVVAVVAVVPGTDVGSETFELAALDWANARACCTNRIIVADMLGNNLLISEIFLLNRLYSYRTNCSHALLPLPNILLSHSSMREVFSMFFVSKFVNNGIRSIRKSAFMISRVSYSLQ